MAWSFISGAHPEAIQGPTKGHHIRTKDTSNHQGNSKGFKNHHEQSERPNIRPKMLLMLLSLMKLQWNYSSVPGTKGIYIYIFFLLFHNSAHKSTHEKHIQLNKLSGIECPHVTSTQIKKQNITTHPRRPACAPFQAPTSP